MKKLIQAAVVTLFAASAAQAQQAVQWKVADGGNGHWYGMRPIDYSRSWSDFIDTCAQIGATPAVLTSSSDADWISSHVVTNPPGDGALLGAELIPTSGGVLEWRWIDGRSFSSSVPWCGGAPGGPTELEHWIYMNDQAHAHPTAPAGCLDDCPWGGWSSINVPWAVIEWSADCNSDGVVDYGQILAGQLSDSNGNGIPDMCDQPTCHNADLYPNNRIDGADLGILLSEWGPVTPSTHSDINHDNQVDGADLGFLLANWGTCPN